MSINRPSQNEIDYFALREAELSAERKRAADVAARDAERKSHFMKCPKCGADLAVEEYHGVEIDRCTECSGIWFDAGEAELVMDKETAGFRGIFHAIVSGVKGQKK
jgi:uncharacterized protein